MNKKYVFTLKSWIALLFLSAIISPFFLPGMHERYMLFGDVVGILYVISNRKRIFNWIASLGIIFISYFSYAHTLFEHERPDIAWFNHDFFRLMELFPWKGVSLLYLGIIVYVIYDLFKMLQNSKEINGNVVS